MSAFHQPIKIIDGVYVIDPTAENRARLPEGVANDRGHSMAAGAQLRGAVGFSVPLSDQLQEVAEKWKEK